MADGKLTIQVDLDGSKAQQGVSRLKSLLSSLGDASSSGFGSGTKSALGFGAAMGAASAIVQKGIGLITSSMGGAVSRVDTMNKFPKMMESWGYSTKQSKAAIDALSKGIDGLPTALDEVVGTTQQLTLMNGDLSKSTKLALALNDAFLASGSSAGDASRGLTQFTQMMSTGKVDMMAWKTLMETMPVGLQKTAEAFGFAGASAKQDLYKALQDGTITFDQFSNKLIELDGGLNGFAELARKNSDGIRTSFKNVGTAVTKGLANMIMEFDNAAKSKGLGGIAENINKLKGVVNSAFSGMTPYISGFVNIISDGIGKVKQFYSIFEGTGAVSAIQSAFGAVGNAIGHVFTSLNVNKSTITDFATVIGDAFVQIAGKIEDVANWISKLDPSTIKQVASAVLGAVAAFKGLKTGASIISSISTALSALSAHPLVALGVAIGALIGWFIHAYTTSETFRNKVNAVVSTIGNVAKAVGNFLKGVDPAFMMTAGAGIIGLLGKFKAFNFLSKFNPFKLFRKNAKDATDGVGKDAGQSKGIIEQIFSGIGTVIEKAGTGISTAAQGIGKGIQSALSGVPAIVTSLGTAITTILTGLGTAISAVATGIGTGLAIAFQGLGAAIAIVPPTTWLALGAAIIMVGIAFAIAGSQADGISQIFQTVGNVIVQVLQQITTSLAILIPIVTNALTQLIPVVAGAIATIITAIAGGIGIIVTAVAGGIAQLIVAVATGWSMIITAISGGIAQVVGAFSGLISAIAGLVSAFGNAFQSMGQGVQAALDGVANVIRSFADVISSVFDGAANVITSFGSAVSGVLDSIAGIFDSIGSAAQRAGAGFKALAQGVVMITNTRLGDMAASLAAVATGVGSIASQGAGLATVGSAMIQLGMGMTMLSASASMAVAGMAGISSAITLLKTSIASLPTTLTLASSGFTSFSAQVIAGMAGLSAVNAPIAALKAQISGITPALVMATIGFSMFSSKAMAMGIGLGFVAAGLARIGSASSSATAQILTMSNACSTISTAFTSMQGRVQAAMQAILSTVRSVGSQMQSQGTQIGRNTANNIANGIRGGIGSASGAMHSLMSAVRSAGMSGVGAMRGIGAMIGQGLAAGMMSALGAVTAAANALVAQAERAARAKAMIHSPSRLFRDNVGRWIPRGMAVGIEKNTKYVDKSLNDMYARVNAFNYKAEDVIGFGNTKFTKVVQIKTDIEQAVKAKVEVAKQKSDELVGKALDVARKATEQPVHVDIDGQNIATATKNETYKVQKEVKENIDRIEGLFA
ncbi:tape measure protein [Streptococcus parauberis]|uniref:tape measure protein n=1 Tax=Streptococcus parauberis TaxID=1348 RepID=UPI00020CBCF5|nr:tape measure protein [Streptococcus parauberis]AEF26041.1 phage protein [Streptococcus parauberis KCTC 11537]QBX27408.1 tail length tape-measure protein [Streptococcus phage Javan386]UWM90905.1 tape measure protein [Streptococcus parauberis]